jgi:hypothetical protein
MRMNSVERGLCREVIRKTNEATKSVPYGSLKSDSIIIFFLWGGTKSQGTAATSGILYKPQMIGEDDCGAIGGMKIGRENRSTRRKPAAAPLCPPQIPHDQTRARTPGRRGGKPAINRLSYGAAKDSCNLSRNVETFYSRRDQGSNWKYHQRGPVEVML